MVGTIFAILWETKKQKKSVKLLEAEKFKIDVFAIEEWEIYPKYE